MDLIKIVVSWTETRRGFASWFGGLLTTTMFSAMIIVFTSLAKGLKMLPELPGQRNSKSTRGEKLFTLVMFLWAFLMAGLLVYMAIHSGS